MSGCCDGQRLRWASIEQKLCHVKAELLARDPSRAVVFPWRLVVAPHIIISKLALNTVPIYLQLSRIATADLLSFSYRLVHLITLLETALGLGQSRW